MSERRRVALGDPQAPFEKVRAILEHHQLLDGHGRLAADVELTSMGDHFDWGGLAERRRAADDGLALLIWLASHPAEQVHLVLGNHNLARVGELALLDDIRFGQALDDALVACLGARGGDPDADRLFRGRWPEVPTAEFVARDVVSFREAQRGLVEDLLRSRRFRIAFAPSHDLLLLHAGVTRDDLAGLGLSPSEQGDAVRVAAALNSALDRALDAWTGGPLDIGALHQPGCAERGEGRGIFYQAPRCPSRPPQPSPGHPVDASIRVASPLGSRRPSATFRTPSAACSWAPGARAAPPETDRCVASSSTASAARIAPGSRHPATPTRRDCFSATARWRWPR